MTIQWKPVGQYFTVVLFFFSNSTKFVILTSLSILDLTLLGVKRTIDDKKKESVCNNVEVSQQKYHTETPFGRATVLS